MIIALIGKTASGKTTIKNRLEKCGFKGITTVTSRPPRKGEKNGKDYIFISRKEFENRIANDEFVEWEEFNGNYYGSLGEDYNDYEYDRVVVLTPSGYIKAKEAIAAEFKSFFVFADDGIIKARLRNRGMSDQEIEDRMKADKQKLNGFRADGIVKSNNTPNLDVAISKITSECK